MTQIIYGLSRDNGDGSCSVIWFRNKELVDYLLTDGKSSDYDEREAFYGNEGSISQTLNFPDDLDLIDCGFFFCDDYYKIGG